MKNMQTFIQEVLAYMSAHGGAWQDWYVGIAEDPRQRLFIDHSVNENGVWIHSHDLGHDSNARMVEKYFLDYGCDGGTGGGSYLTRYVYAFKKTPHTRR